MAKAHDPENSAWTTKLDMCLTDLLIKSGVGTLIGTTVSMCWLKGRRWPIIIAFGIGVGSAWANCEYELNKRIK